MRMKSKGEKKGPSNQQLKEITLKSVVNYSNTQEKQEVYSKSKMVIPEAC